LNIVQDRQQRPLAPGVGGEDFRKLLALSHRFSRSACQLT
jgi:hypothetical protein